MAFDGRHKHTRWQSEWYNYTQTMAIEAKTIRIVTLQEQDKQDDLQSTTAAQRLEMMWQLTLDAWAFKGDPVAEFPLQRNLVRVIRLDEK
jgi:hypothetical protein